MIHVGDCRVVMPTLPADSVDSIVTDPPYGLSFMGKGWDHAVPGAEFWEAALRVAKPGAYLAAFGGTRTFHRLACAIEDAGWELRDTLMWVYSTGFPKSLNLDRERGKTICGCSRQPVPYAHEKTPGESKAQREVRAVLDAHVPEALDSGEGRGEVLQPRLQEQGASIAGRSELPSPEVRGQQPSVEGRGDTQEVEGELQGRAVCQGSGVGEAYGSRGRVHHGTSAGHGADLRVPADSRGSRGPLGPRPVEQPSVEPRSVPDERGPQARGAWPVCAGCGKPRLPEGLGTALKPAWEPIILARKPLEGTVAANVLAHGTGGLNIDRCRVGKEGARNNGRAAGTNGIYGHIGATERVDYGMGRWPANLIHDGSDEVVAAFPRAPGQQGTIRGSEPSAKTANTFGEFAGRSLSDPRGDTGSAARFFYCAKATRDDRNAGCEHMEKMPLHWSSGDANPGSFQAEGTDKTSQNNHPTVKPTELMRWLCRLVTPAGGLVLDPFAGSGSTGRGAAAEGMRFEGIELDPHYAAIAEARIRVMQPGLGF